MKKGDIIELQTIDKRGFISFQHLKINNAEMAKKQLAEKGYHPMSTPNTYFCSHQYEPKRACWGTQKGNLRGYSGEGESPSSPSKKV